MISIYDDANIVFYFLFVIGVGIHFLRRSTDTFDCFRAGGALPWWITGASAWMAAFSAWTFTARRFRRMRVVTLVESVRLSFGPQAQQVVTRLRLPMILIFGGIGLNAVSVVMAAVFDRPVLGVMAALGVSVALLALLGGSIGVAASDFVQMRLKVAATLTTLEASLNQGAGIFVRNFYLTKIDPTCSAWFFATSLFYGRGSEDYRAGVDEFFTRLHTPVHADEPTAGSAQATAHRKATIATLCVIHGGFLFALGILVPNAWSGRICFFACGGTMLLVGLALRTRT